VSTSPKIDLFLWEGIAGATADHIWLKTSSNTTSSISVTNTSIPVTSSGTSVVQSAAGRAMQNRKSAADSTLNSLECWDYSVELECLRGPDGSLQILC